MTGFPLQFPSIPSAQGRNRADDTMKLIQRPTDPTDWKAKIKRAGALYQWGMTYHPDILDQMRRDGWLATRSRTGSEELTLVMIPHMLKEFGDPGVGARKAKEWKEKNKSKKEKVIEVRSASAIRTLKAVRDSNMDDESKTVATNALLEWV